MIWLIKVLVYDVILNPILSSKFNVTIEPRFMVVEPKILIVLSFYPYALNYCIFICCIFSCTEGRALASARALAI